MGVREEVIQSASLVRRTLFCDRCGRDIATGHSPETFPWPQCDICGVKACGHCIKVLEFGSVLWENEEVQHMLSACQPCIDLDPHFVGMASQAMEDAHTKILAMVAEWKAIAR